MVNLKKRWLKLYQYFLIENNWVMNISVLKKISNLMYLLRLKNPSKKKILSILVYHGVSELPQKNCVTIKQFEEHLLFLKKNFNLVTLDEIIEIIKFETEPAQNTIAITFDDGYTNFYSNAYPLIKKYNIPAIVYIPSELLNLYNKWDFPEKPNYPKMHIMQIEQINQLDHNLISIGSHSATHRRMSDLNDEDLKWEIFSSKTHLENVLKKKINHFAFPYGGLSDFDRRTYDMLKEAGYKSASSTLFSRFNTKSDKYSLKRISIWDDDTVKDLEKKLCGYYDWLVIKEQFAHRTKKWINTLTQ